MCVYNVQAIDYWTKARSSIKRLGLTIMNKRDKVLHML